MDCEEADARPEMHALADTIVGEQLVQHGSASWTLMRRRLLPLPLLSVFTTSKRPISRVERT